MSGQARPLALILRDHREQLRLRWIDELQERVGTDYRELLASPIGERAVRTVVDDLVAVTQAEEYEVPAILRRVDRQAGQDAAHWVSLGFSPRDVVGALHALRLAIIDVLLDALVQDEMPSFGDSLAQLRVLDGFLDRMAAACLTAT